MSIQARELLTPAAFRRAMLRADDMLTIYRTVEDFNERHRGYHQHWTGNLPERHWNPPPVKALRSAGEYGERARREVVMARDRLPPIEALQNLLSVVQAFESEPANPAKTRLLVALYVDRFPNGRPHNPVAYLEGLCAQADRGGYSPTQVSKACDTLLTKNNFLAAPAEFHAALEASKFPGVSSRSLTRAIEVWEKIDAAIREANELGPLDDGSGPPLWEGR